MVFCVFNWHELLLRAQMDDWTANMIMCVVACYLCLGRLPKGTQKQQQSTRAKKRDFSIWCSWVGTPKEHSYLIKGSPKSDEPKKKDSSKNKTTQKHIHRERYDEKSSIDIPDDAFFKRRTTEEKEDEFDESVHELFFQGVKKDDDDD